MFSKVAIFLSILFLLFGLASTSMGNWLWHYTFKGVSIEVGAEDYEVLLRTGQLKYKPRNFWLLYQPESERVVSLVDKNKDGKYSLNPKSVTWNSSWKVDYGDIPELKEITVDRLNALWGQPIRTNSEFATYALSTYPPMFFTLTKVVHPANYFIDAKFRYGYLHAYRLRYTDRFNNLNNSWINVSEI